MSQPGLAPSSDLQPGRSDLALGDEHDHVVQFYDDDAFLGDVVADFLLAGARNGEPLVMVATEAHRNLVLRRLAAAGLDTDQAARAGRLTVLDARETLARFMVDGKPSTHRYREVVGGILERALATGGGPRVRAYGEMVDLLWQDGQRDAAIRLEQQWNDAGEVYPMSLLCAYRMDGFRSQADGQAFEDVCRTHRRVRPAEDYLALPDAESRARQISILQQRARALESEVAYRKAIEKALRDALKVRDDFLCVAGHELRTPLTVLRLQMSSLINIAQETGDDRLQRRLALTSSQTARLAGLIEQVLDVSRIDAGMVLDRTELDLGALVRDVVECFTDVAARAGCRVTALADEPVPAFCDRGRIEQVVTNLLSNAVKFGRGTPIQVVVRRTRGLASISVRDGGMGVAAADQQRIFQRFERGVSVQSFGGLGLGLWVVKEIVDAHGGAIRVESEPEKGATFVVELPPAP